MGLFRPFRGRHEVSGSDKGLTVAALPGTLNRQEPSAGAWPIAAKVGTQQGWLDLRGCVPPFGGLAAAVVGGCVAARVRLHFSFALPSDFYPCWLCPLWAFPAGMNRAARDPADRTTGPRKDASWQETPTMGI